MIIIIIIIIVSFDTRLLQKQQLPAQITVPKLTESTLHSRFAFTKRLIF